MKIITKEIDPYLNYLFIIKTRVKPDTDLKEGNKAAMNKAMGGMHRYEKATHDTITKESRGTLDTSGSELPLFHANSQYIVFFIEEAEEAFEISDTQKQEELIESEIAFSKIYNPKNLPGRVRLIHLYNASIEIIESAGEDLYRELEEPTQEEIKISPY